jgi:ribosomal protein S18 acetylase RimI-like enzyme
VLRLRKPAAQVHSLAVEPAMRRKGIARALLRQALRHAGFSGASVVRCEVRASNVASAKFFEGAGFVAQSLRPAMYADGEAGIRYERRL